MGRFSFPPIRTYNLGVISRKLVKALRQGSGKAYALVQDDLNAAFPVLLRFMNEPISNEIQNNGTHAQYLYDLLKLCPNRLPFLDELLKARSYSLRNQDLFAHRVALLGLFARDGIKPAMDRLVFIYRSMIKTIYRQKGDFPFYFFGDFNELLLAMTVDGPTFSRLAKDMLRLMEDRRIEYGDIDWYFMSQCMEYRRTMYQDPYFDQAYRLCKDDIYDMERTRKEIDQIKAHRKRQKPKPISVEGMSEQEILETLPSIIEGASTSDDKLLLRCLKKLDYSFQKDAAHPSIMAIARNPDLSKDVYLYAYERSYCSGCRARIFKHLIRNGYRDSEFLIEATHDCEEEVVKIAAKILKTTQN